MSKIFRSSILAGICIAIGGFVYLNAGMIPGAILFAFGLLSVVNYRLKLFTGTAGFIQKGDFPSLLLILLGNIIGCFVVALIARTSSFDMQGAAQEMLQKRIESGWWKCGAMSIGCGIIMTTAVTFARKGVFFPLIFGVPTFILCGFPHCIAEAFFYLTAPFSSLRTHIWEILPIYLSVVAGNFLGCNLFRLILPEINEE